MLGIVGIWSYWECYRRGGYYAVCAALDGDDTLEHWFTRTAAEITYQITGDESARREIQMGRAPGDAHLLPGWALQNARDVTKQIFLQAGRVRAQRGGGLRVG